MKTARPRKPALLPADIDQLEHHLQAALRPVKPRPEFTGYMRQRLSDPPARRASSGELSSLQLAILAVVGLTGGLVVLIAGLRALLSLIDAGKNRTLVVEG
jgi:hypothetical protein